MVKINELVINGFKAFPSKFDLKFEGKHLLMYGENGSGKSSIYYAFHCIFNSIRKPDIGKKYFNKDNSQNLINKYYTPKGEKDVSSVLINWYDGSNPFVSTLSYEGCKSETQLLELDTCFINHQFLFSFFNFTNSKTVNLFPIFQMEILPYIFDDTNGLYVSQIYEQIILSASKLGNGNSSKEINQLIEYLNDKIEAIIGDINLKINSIYNDNFGEISEKQLDVTLLYPKTNDSPDIFLNGYQLKWDYPLIIDKNGKLAKASNKSLNEPLIRIVIKEDGVLIEKPQAYFNEAKLTAIALSIRFSLLNMESPNEGSFLALDDMLISLDMSNRTKVIDFLLKISDKYKIYLFTHDRAFFELAKEMIKSVDSEYISNWLFKEIYNNDDVRENPKCFDSETSYARAIKHYHNFDYPASANYLRKSVEELMSFFPIYISKDDNGETKEKLRSKLNTALALLKNLDGNIADLQYLVEALNLLLNPLSHRSIDTNIYKSELKKIIDIIPRVKRQILALEIKEIIAQKNKVFFNIKENETTSCKITIELDTPIYSYLGIDKKRHLSASRGKTISSITTKNGIIGAEQRHNYNNGTLGSICKQLHDHLGKEYDGNYWDFYQDKDGKLLSLFL